MVTWKRMPVKENFYYLHPGFEEACHAMHSLMESTRFGQETDGMREGMAQKLDCIFCKKGKEELRTD